MKIGMVLRKTFPPDIRIEKEARALLGAGHRLHLLAYQSGNRDEPVEEEIDGLRVRRIPREPNQLRTAKRILNSLCFYLTFTNPYWASHIERYARDFRLDALHVHDLPLAGTALRVSQKLSIPLIVDLHENYPASLRLTVEGNPTLKSQFKSQPGRWATYEKRAVHSATRVIVVVDEAKQRLMTDYGLEAEKITVVMNVEDMDFFKRLDLDQGILSRYKDFFVISYIGGGGKHRGIDTVIEALSYVRQSISQIKLLLVGMGQEESSRYRAMAEIHSVQDHIETIDWQPFHKIPSFIMASEIGLVPHHQNPHTDATIPHKLFQYMILKKPVIVSSCRPLKRIVEETKSGLVFRSGDPQDLAKQIHKLYVNPRLRFDCGVNGHEAVSHRYNWLIEGKKLTQLYQSLSQHKKTEFEDYRS